MSVNKEGIAPLTPRRWLLLDAAGALLSVLILGLLIPVVRTFFRFPLDMLYVLAVIPAGYIVVDLIGYFVIGGDGRRVLRFVAICNFLYCLVAIGMAINHASTLTVWGWVYVSVEVLVIATLAAVEMRVALR